MADKQMADIEMLY